MPEIPPGEKQAGCICSPHVSDWKLQHWTAVYKWISRDAFLCFTQGWCGSLETSLYEPLCITKSVSKWSCSSNHVLWWIKPKKDMWSSFQTTETIWVLITVSTLHVPRGFKCDFLLSCRALQLPFLIPAFFPFSCKRKETKMKMKLVGKINFLQKCSAHRFRDVMHGNPDISIIPTPSTIVLFFFEEITCSKTPMRIPYR